MELNDYSIASLFQAIIKKIDNVDEIYEVFDSFKSTFNQQMHNFNKELNKIREDQGRFHHMAAPYIETAKTDMMHLQQAFENYKREINKSISDIRKDSAKLDMSKFVFKLEKKDA